MTKKRAPVETNDLLRAILPADGSRQSLTELHVHLGGSVPIYRLWEMGIARGIRGAAENYNQFIAMLHRSKNTAGSLDNYLAIFDLVELIQAGPAAVQECVRIAINGAYRTGGMRHLGPGGEGGDPNPVFAITQLELRFNPMKRTGVILSKGVANGLYDVDRVMRGACQAVEESEIAYRGAIRSGLLICFGRDMSWEANYTLAEKVKYWSAQSKHIVGIDLAGPESAISLADKNDRKKMAEIYEIAGATIGRTIHCGETEHISIDTFLATIEDLNPHRVAHPITAYRAYVQDKDARGLELLAERGITCELCFQSNLLTGALPDAAAYGRMLAAFDSFNIPYTFSTDSPALQLTTLAAELQCMLSENVASREQVLGALEHAAQATFLHLRD